ncbi:hypothetical protein [Paracoccus aestuarii]|uniref:hypothetical protein n=1 Tax=Paracoccus aestuarii TaxID=453842 RepID=UPI00234FDF29|nr:hypothetical protein [Paracoccus aestuarii]WCQ99759.1 hypothetical protein JHW48_03205 [Paracoccus aestuarii]
MDQPRPCCRARVETTRPAHRCRGRGDRACRCHVDARPALSRPPAPPRILTLPRRDRPAVVPLTPQAPPFRPSP